MTSHERWPVSLRRSWLPVCLFLVFAGLLAVQLFLPPFIGMANNGDFAKVIGWLSLGPSDSGDSNFSYFQPDYILSQRSFWQSPYYSSETVLAWVALAAAARLGHATGEGAHFDIRVQAAVHAALYLAAFALLLWCVRRAPAWSQLAVGSVAILAFTDVSNVAYLSSFFMDAAALCGLLLLVASAAWIAVTDQPSPGQVLLYGLAGVLYVTSKTQHAIWLWLPAAFLVAVSLGWPKRGAPKWMRTLGLLTAAIVVAAGGWELLTADPGNRAQALFNKLFFQIGPAGPAGRADLLELGVRPEEFQYIGTHSYVAGSPASDPPWLEAFYQRTGYGRLLVWYIRRPERAARMLYQTLSVDAAEMRQNNLSNYRRQDGHPPGARTNRFALWSNIRAALFARWPYHAVVWYGLFVGGAIATVRAGASRPAVQLGWLGLGIAVLGIGQFMVASLADCLETARHIFTFHVCTDMTICLAAVWLADYVSRHHGNSHLEAP